MSCHEVQALVASGAYAYVDVRSPEEYAAAHPEGAVNVPVWLKDSSGGFVPNPAFLSDFKSRFDSSAQLCVGCASGKRSQAAIAMLQPEGYSDLINVEGGFSAWAGAGLPVAK
jgi:rhodanese-related sulfurtransferase